MPGGLIGRARLAFGANGGRIAAAATLTERLLLAAVGCGVAAHYGASLVVTREALAFAGGLATEEFTVVLAIVLVGLLWIRARIGFDLDSDAIARGTWVGVAILAVLSVWGTVTLVREKTLLDQFAAPAIPAASIRTYLLALVFVLPVV